MTGKTYPNQISKIQGFTCTNLTSNLGRIVLVHIKPHLDLIQNISNLRK